MVVVEAGMELDDSGSLRLGWENEGGAVYTPSNKDWTPIASGVGETVTTHSLGPVGVGVNWQCVGA